MESRDSDGAEAAAFLEAHAGQMKEAEQALLDAVAAAEKAEAAAKKNAEEPEDEEPVETPRFRSNLDEMWNLVHEAEVRSKGRSAR